MSKPCCHRALLCRKSTTLTMVGLFTSHWVNLQAPLHALLTDLGVVIEDHSGAQGSTSPLFQVAPISARWHGNWPAAQPMEAWQCLPRLCHASIGSPQQRWCAPCRLATRQGCHVVCWHILSLSKVLRQSTQMWYFSSSFLKAGLAFSKAMSSCWTKGMETICLVSLAFSKPLPFSMQLLFEPCLPGHLLGSDQLGIAPGAFLALVRKNLFQGFLIRVTGGGVIHLHGVIWLPRLFLRLRLLFQGVWVWAFGARRPGQGALALPLALAPFPFSKVLPALGVASFSKEAALLAFFAFFKAFLWAFSAFSKASSSSACCILSRPSSTAAKCFSKHALEVGSSFSKNDHWRAFLLSVLLLLVVPLPVALPLLLKGSMAGLSQGSFSKPQGKETTSGEVCELWLVLLYLYTSMQC